MNKFLNPKKYIKNGISSYKDIFSRFLYKLESHKIEFYGNQPLKLQPIFIIGAPRTGSTVLYQTLTNLYDVLYINNAICRFYKNLFLGFWFSSILWRTKPHNNFQSYHGRTKGWNSPSECGEFWYRWLPKDHHFIDFHEINFDFVKQIRQEISAVTNYFRKPIVFKNLNAGQRIRLLTLCFPDAKFLFITRDPLYTAQSILRAKEKLKLNGNDFWSVMPHNVEKLKRLPWDEQIVRQIYFLEKQIVQDSSLIKYNNFFTIHYKNLSINYIHVLSNKLGLTKRRSAKFPDIRIKEKNIISDKNFELLNQKVKTLDWSFTPPDSIA